MTMEMAVITKCFKNPAEVEPLLPSYLHTGVKNECVNCFEMND